MSLNVFKTQLLRYMQTEPETSDDFAEYLTSQYDAAVKRGYDTLNLVPIQTGNTNTMEAVLKALFKKNNTILSGVLTIADYGPAFQSYWTGAQGALFPLPVIPAPGSFQNIVSNTHIIVNPGVWSAVIPTPPTTSPTAWIDALTLGIITHLPTIQGLIVTTSLYPTAPAPTPAPGIINWTGYSIPG